MQFMSKYRGDDFCPECGEKLKWVRLLSGMWIAVQEQPILYVPGAGKMWLVEPRNRDAVIMKDCLIYKPGLGINHKDVITGFEPHVFSHRREG